MDALDLVREYFGALNRGDLDAALAALHEHCEAERLLTTLEAASDAGEARGREDYRRGLEAFFQAFEGGFDEGARFRLRTIAPIEAGWVHVEWQERERRRSTGEILEFVGYSHFLVEEGVIRRERTVRQDALGPEIEAAPSSPSTRSYPARPVVGVGAVILMDARVVLIKRRFEPLAGQWSLPGGALEVGETLTAGVAREILEETGLQVEVGPVIEVFDRILLDEEKRVRYHFVLIDYLCRPLGGRLQAGSDVADVALAEPADLDRYRLTPKASAIIARGVEMARAG